MNFAGKKGGKNSGAKKINEEALSPYRKPHAATLSFMFLINNIFSRRGSLLVERLYRDYFAPN